MTAASDSLSVDACQQATDIAILNYALIINQITHIPRFGTSFVYKVSVKRLKLHS